MKQRIKISIVISAYNEEKKIKECLESVKWTDETIFVNNASTDKTVEIAKRYTSKIFTQPNNLMLNVNKNFGFSKATGDWILSLDADERVATELQKEILSIVNGPLRSEASKVSTVNGYWIPRKNIIFGKWIQSEMWWPDYQLRFFRRGKGKFPQVHVHEYIKVEGETARLTNPMLHENYTSVAQFLYKMDKIYTENEASNIIASGHRLHWTDALRMPASDFFKTFFLQKGYKDGLHGLILSLLQAFYAVVVFAKVWEKEGFKEENPQNFLQDMYKECRRIANEFLYWHFTSVISDTRNTAKKLFYRILRKRVTGRLKKDN